MNKRTSRRGFLKTATASAAGTIILGQSSSAWSYQANERLNIALIGVGDRGRGFIRKVDSMGQNLVAICDADQRRIDAARDVPSGARAFKDYRILLDEMDDQLDAVIIATPHHSQAAISSAAMRRNKHVYCEKPIAQEIGEARDLRALSAQHPVVTQMGNQGLASDSYRRVLEQVEDGAVGEIREAHQWFISDYRRDPRDEAVPPPDPTAIPEGLDWDLYLGPAMERPYHHAYMRWARWRDFATGMLGMGGSHSCHMTFNSLNLRPLWEGDSGSRSTIRVSAEYSPDAEPLDGPADGRFPQWEVVRFEIPARGSLPPAKINWYKGREDDLARLGVLDELEKKAGRSLDWGRGWASRSGSLVVGSKGMVHTNMHNSECALLPLADFPNQGGRPQRLPRSGSHEREWVNACVGRGPKPMSNFDYAGPVLELLLLGNICTLLGRPIEYDPMAGKIIGDDEADRQLRPPRRDGWEV